MHILLFWQGMPLGRWLSCKLWKLGHVCSAYPFWNIKSICSLTLFQCRAIFLPEKAFLWPAAIVLHTTLWWNKYITYFFIHPCVSLPVKCVTSIFHLMLSDTFYSPTRKGRICPIQGIYAIRCLSLMRFFVPFAFKKTQKKKLSM